MSLLPQEWYLQIIDELYQTLFDPSRLSEVLERIMHGLNSESAILRLQYLDDRSVGFSIYHGYEKKWQESYQAYFRQLDPYPEIIGRYNKETFDRDVLPVKDLEKTEYYNDFLRPQDKLYCMGGHLLRTEHYYVQFAFQRGPKSTAYHEEEIRALRILVPHMKRMLTLNQQMTSLNTRNRITELALAQLPYGVILFDAALKPMFVNHLAETLLSGQAGLRLTSGNGLTTVLASESRALSQMLRQGVAQATGRGPLTRNAMRITPLQEDHHFINAVVVPLSPGQRKMSLFLSQPGVMLILSTLDHPVTRSSALLKTLFDLTGAEAHLAQELASGRNLEEVAAAKGCSLNTVRNQLKAVFAKTGSNRQAELIRLVNSLPLAAPSGQEQVE
ncbi:MAG: hypothetical protein H7834_06645 [Magnetococcus sp. YQC-9]